MTPLNTTNNTVSETALTARAAMRIVEAIGRDLTPDVAGDVEQAIRVHLETEGTIGGYRLLDTTTPGQTADREVLLDLLYDAWGVIANAGFDEGGWSHEHPAWTAAAERWRDRFHDAAVYDRPGRPRGALVEVIERYDPVREDPTGPGTPGVLIPNEIRLNGVPLLITEDGPVVHAVNIARRTPAEDTPPDDRDTGECLVTMTVLARRVVFGSEPALVGPPVPTQDPDA